MYDLIISVVRPTSLSPIPLQSTGRSELRILPSMLVEGVGARLSL